MTVGSSWGRGAKPLPRGAGFAWRAASSLLVLTVGGLGACGGTSESGTTGGGGTGSGGGSASGGGASLTGGADGMSSCEVNGSVVCVEDCFAERGFVLPVCENGRQICPSGSIDRTECPEDSCAGSLEYCCDSITGEHVLNPCGDEGTREACPDPLHPSGQQWCLPDGLDVEECGALAGESCVGEARFCRSAGPRETSCTCPEETNLWVCVVSTGP